jgi:hypothetical protein
VDAKLEVLRTFAALCSSLVLGNVDEPSSLVASLSIVVESFESRVDTATANRVRWGIRSVLAATLSHFLELKSELDLLRFGRNADLTDDQADAL